MQVSTQYRRGGRLLRTWLKILRKNLLELKITDGLWENCSHRSVIHMAGLNNVGRRAMKMTEPLIHSYVCTLTFLESTRLIEILDGAYHIEVIVDPSSIHTTCRLKNTLKKNKIRRRVSMYANRMQRELINGEI